MPVVAIKRTDRADRAHWVPVFRDGTYQLVDRNIPYPARNWRSKATFEASLDKAGDLVESGHAIRMGEPGAHSGDYIYPKDLEVIRT